MNLRSCIPLVLAGAIIAVRHRINGAPDAANWRHGGRHLMGTETMTASSARRASGQQAPPARAGRRQEQWSGRPDFRWGSEKPLNFWAWLEISRGQDQGPVREITLIITSPAAQKAQQQGGERSNAMH